MNLEIWDKVRAVPQNAQKEITGGRLKGKTDINPMWRIKALTEQFGVCGVGWKYVITNKWTEKGFGDEIAAFVDIDLFVKQDNKWSEAIPGTGGSMLVAKEKNGPYTSDECFKMALTDAISVACKALGFGADIYWQGDRSKYDNPNTEHSSTTQANAHSNAHSNTQDNQSADHSKKVKELMNLAKSLYGEEKAIQCIKEYLTLGNYAKTDKIPEDKLKHFESFIDMFDTHLPEGI